MVMLKFSWEIKERMLWVFGIPITITLTQDNHIPPVMMLWVFMWPIFEMMLSTTRRAYMPLHHRS